MLNRLLLKEVRGLSWYHLMLARVSTLDVRYEVNTWYTPLCSLPYLHSTLHDVQTKCTIPDSIFLTKAHDTAAPTITSKCADSHCNKTDETVISHTHHHMQTTEEIVLCTDATLLIRCHLFPGLKWTPDIHHFAHYHIYIALCMMFKPSALYQTPFSWQKHMTLLLLQSHQSVLIPIAIKLMRLLSAIPTTTCKPQKKLFCVLMLPCSSGVICSQDWTIVFFCIAQINLKDLFSIFKVRFNLNLLLNLLF